MAKTLVVQTTREWPLSDTTTIPKGSVVGTVQLEDVVVLDHARKPLKQPYSIGIRQLADGIRSGQFTTAAAVQPELTAVSAPDPTDIVSDPDQAGSLDPHDLSSLLGEGDVP